MKKNSLMNVIALCSVLAAVGMFAYVVNQSRMISYLSSDPKVCVNCHAIFGQPDVTVIVADATRLERNLNLVLQVLEITERAVVCLNLMDEAKRHGIMVDDRQLSRDLGVPVVPTSARYGQGLPELLQAINEVATGEVICRPRRLETVPAAIQPALDDLIGELKAAFPELPNTRWVALRLLSGDDSIVKAVRSGQLGLLHAFADAEPRPA